ERIAARAVAGAEPSLEVRAPGLIGAIDRRERPPIGRRANPRLAAVRQPGPLQHFPHRAFGRPQDVRMRRGPFYAQVPRPPVPAFARGDDVRDDVVAELTG